MAKAAADPQEGDTVQILKDDDNNGKYGVVDEITESGTFMVIIGSGAVRHEYTAEELDVDWDF